MVNWTFPTEFTALRTKRARKCCSCGDRIAHGDECAEVPRGKVPENAMEVRIYSEEGLVPLASKWMCETCAGLAFALDDLGYCSQPWLDQRALVQEYAELNRGTAFPANTELRKS